MIDNDWEQGSEQLYGVAAYSTSQDNRIRLEGLECWESW